MTCPSCRAGNDERADRCAHCGPPPTGTALASERPSPLRGQRARVRVGFLIAIVVVLAAAGYWFVRSQAHTPVGCMNGFIEADRARRDDELVRLVASGDDPKRFLADWLRVRAELGDTPFRTCRIFDVAPMGEERAAILVAITVPTRGKPGLRAHGQRSRHTEIVPVNLVRQGGAWRIVGPGMRAAVAKVLIGCGYPALVDLAAGAPGGKGPGMLVPPKPGSRPSSDQAAKPAAP